ncbi:hypothetical protein WA026_002625 [Henosepilachna vigintioctopunctata]|uniref:Uncharacterized protein n=1 Tax=Henosepilachna vigintioctopunctata TaxID=420089 RepID=A0AAW1U002_9CUCU
MSGYKRVNYYELCRLCATNQQKEKTHIFQEEGRKIQLLDKIESCLSITVYEHDYLPKVVCSKCLRLLESYYIFKQECVSSETMLSSYFKNFRYTEDFKKSGKVYIKDTINKSAEEDDVEDSISMNNQVVTSTETLQVGALPQNPTLLQNYAPISSISNDTKSTHHQNSTQIEQVHSYYAVQVPHSAIVTNHPPIDTKISIKHEPSRNIVTANIKNHQKSQESMNNVVVNANGEVINIGHLVDLESLMNQGPPPKITKCNNVFKQKRVKETKLPEDPIIKIDLTESENRNTFFPDLEKLPHIKSTHSHHKYSYGDSKVDDKVQVNASPSVIFNTGQDYQTSSSNFVPFHQNSGNMNYSNTSSNNINVALPSVCTSTNNEHSTVNLNALNGDIGGGSYRKSTMIEGIKIENVFSVKNSVLNNDKLHMCDICPKTFKRREHLYQHLKLHTGFRPYICEHCNKSFMRKEHLLRHMTSHSGQKNYTCSICEKSFSRNDNLLKHKKTHGKQTSFTCEVCQKQFVMKHYYLAHKVTHEVGERCVSQTLGILKA